MDNEGLVMGCQRCYSNTVASINAKCSDRFYCILSNTEYSGYVPSSLGIGSFDYVEFSYCLTCGQIQGDFPLYVDFEELEGED